MKIDKVTVNDIFSDPAFPALEAEYYAECHNPEMGPMGIAQDLYHKLEDVGALHAIAAYDDDLIGFTGVMITPSPHYGGRWTAHMESVFVTSKYRHTCAGLRLIRAAEQLARHAGCEWITGSAPTGSRLDRVFPRIGYRNSDMMFCRSL